jgi:hypothetical protein
VGDLRRRKAHDSAVVVRPERASPAAAAPPSEAAILELQRSAGNAAVNVAHQVAKGTIELAYDALWGMRDILPFEYWMPMISSVRAASYQVDTIKANINTELALAESRRLQAETEAIKAETAAIQAETARKQDHKAGHPGSRPGERLQVLGQIAGGLSDDVELTDRVFLARHPERQADPLRPEDPGDAELINEWRTIRRTVVAQVLGSELAKVIRLAGVGSATVAGTEASGPGPNAG